MKVVSLTGTIVLLCTSTATVQSMAIGTHDSMATCYQRFSKETQSLEDEAMVIPSSHDYEEAGDSQSGGGSNKSSCCGCTIM
ncbi:uncharacterized protein MELLADRAFT_124372 [Melampsora larici-populina 98AG31]|uniref:Secreted protein n=1 Tax=Melampsora larici-populina (strain 98AG31 / pathotype 3-4-7) TaxID=747676 RepID=F4RCG0_MELLP|nr:uncharacterized protein MELLADRAFT_124372 [Melampsora larici-populina 98AG31]EGG09725.1 secreted protein [Melampsora larici-populina 98AG31]